MSEDKKPEARPGVYPGDEVYFDHAAGPRAGRVLAHGRHGCTIECEGRRHKVKWEKVLGHKKRSELHYDVLEEGEDGMIVADASGRRRFIGVQTPDAPERVVVRGAKSKQAEPVDASEESTKPAPRENPEPKKPGHELRKSDAFPKILLWSGRS